MLDISQSPPKSSAIKVTAEQIEKGCPTAIEVQALGFRIAAHLKTMRGYEAKAREKAGVELRKADDNWTTVTQLLAEAKEKCSTGGFKAFKEKFCPNLSRSRIYELLQIGSGKKTLEESRAANRERIAKHRRDKRVSVTDDVTDKAGNKSDLSNSILKSNLPAPIDAPNEAEPEAKPALTAKFPEAEPAFFDGAEDEDELGPMIENEWCEAEFAFEALTARTIAQVAQAIPPGKAALVTEIADYFTALAAKLTAHSAGDGEAPAAGSNVSIPDDLNIPPFLQRDAS